MLAVFKLILRLINCIFDSLLALLESAAIEYYYNWIIMSKSNVILQKSELGKNKQGFHELPNDNHVYGKAPPKDQYGAREGNTHLTQLSQDGKNILSLLSNNQEKTLLLWTKKALKMAVSIPK